MHYRYSLCMYVCMHTNTLCLWGHTLCGSGHRVPTPQSVLLVLLTCSCCPLPQGAPRLRVRRAVPVRTVETLLWRPCVETLRDYGLLSPLPGCVPSRASSVTCRPCRPPTPVPLPPPLRLDLDLDLRPGVSPSGVPPPSPLLFLGPPKLPSLT